MKDGNINNDEAKKYLKLSKTWRVVKLTTLNWLTSQVIISILTLKKTGLLSSIYLKLINEDIGINVVKLNIEEFKDEIDKLEKKKAKKESYKRNKKEVLENAKALYDGVKIIIDEFEREVWRSSSN